MVDMEAIKAKLRESAQKKTGEGRQQSGGDNASYAFWNIPEDSSALIRFLPDGDADNVFFWQKREVIKLPFEGVEGGDYPTNRQVTVQVPCVDMFGMACPITAAIRPWWNDERKDLARVYYKKKSYVFQGFVVQSPFQEQNTPENPIRRFILNPSLYNIVEKSLMNPDMEESPTDYISGRDFKITKTKKGQYADYSTSTWSFKTRSLSENELIAVDQHGLHNLKSALGRVPDADELEAIKAMFQDSVDGKPFDMASYGKYYRPYGNRDDADAGPATTAAPVRSFSTPSASAPAPTAAPAPVAQAPVQAPVTETAEAAPAGAKPSPQEILERIRNRSSAAR